MKKPSNLPPASRILPNYEGSCGVEVPVRYLGLVAAPEAISEAGGIEGPLIVCRDRGNRGAGT